MFHSKAAKRTQDYQDQCAKDPSSGNSGREEFCADVKGLGKFVLLTSLRNIVDHIAVRRRPLLCRKTRISIFLSSWDHGRGVVSSSRPILSYHARGDLGRRPVLITRAASKTREGMQARPCTRHSTHEVFLHDLEVPTIVQEDLHDVAIQSTIHMIFVHLLWSFTPRGIGNGGIPGRVPRIAGTTLSLWAPPTPRFRHLPPTHTQKAQGAPCGRPHCHAPLFPAAPLARSPHSARALQCTDTLVPD